MVVKHSELPPEHQVEKGRVLFRGNNVQDEAGFAAVFSEQGSSASHLSAANFLDVIGHMPGNEVDNADAEGAYTQSPMLEDDTWISLPWEAIPKEYKAKFASIKNPVVPMVMALEGHPRAGKFWEEYCRATLLQRGWELVEGWECLYFHRKLMLFLSIYVDDFKMA